jgi:hypothetical protein
VSFPRPLERIISANAGKSSFNDLDKLMLNSLFHL